MTQAIQSALEAVGDQYDHKPLMVRSITESEYLFVLSWVPNFRLRLSVESDYSRKLDQMGLSDEIKLNDSHLDTTYVVRSATAEFLREHLTEELKTAIRNCEPFVELELTSKEFRLIREVPEAQAQRVFVEQTLQHLNDLANFCGHAPEAEPLHPHE